MPVERYLFLMNGWASTAGGIQTVNREMVSASAKLRSYAKFTVLAPQASREEINNATSRGVELISGGGQGPDDWAAALMSPELAQIEPDEVVALIGHSSFSGDAARLLRDRHFPKAQLVQFIHMTPLRTEGLKEYRQDNYVLAREEKVKRELDLAAAADIVVCIGPRLFRYTRDTLVARGISDARVHSINCGLAPPATPRVSPLNPTILCLGRTDSLNVKGLDIFAYAAGFLTEAWKGHPSTSAKPAPNFVVRGVKNDGEDLEKRLISLAEKVGSRPSLIARPYTTAQRDLAADYAGASIFMMPSREEGFGLVACEALSQGVPVLLSENSGIAELARQVMGQHHLKEQPCLISMGGSTQEIGRRFADAALEILTDETNLNGYYQILRERMLPRASWDAGADSLLSVIDQARSQPNASNGFDRQAEINSAAQAVGISAETDLATVKEELLAKKGVMAVSLKQAYLVIIERGQQPNLPSEIGGIEVIVREVESIKLSSSLAPTPDDGLYFEGQRIASVATILVGPDNTLYAITAAHAIAKRSMHQFEVKLGANVLPAKAIKRAWGRDLALVELPKNSHTKRPWDPSVPEQGERVMVRIGDRSWNARVATVELAARIEGVDGGPLHKLFEVTIDGALPEGASGAIVEGVRGEPLGMILAAIFERKDFVNSYIAQEFSGLEVPGFSIADLRQFESGIKIAVVTPSTDVMAALAGIDAITWATGSILGRRMMTGRIGANGPIITATTTEKFGAVGTAIETTKTLYTQTPDLIVQLGLCAGLKANDQKIGDVVISTEVVSIAGGTSPDGRFFPTMQFFSDGRDKIKDLVGNAVAEMRHSEFKVHIGRVAAVDGVVHNVDQVNRIREYDRNLLGLNMDSGGFAQSVQDFSDYTPPIMILVNGIADYADGQKDDGGRQKAATNASQALVNLILALHRPMYHL